MFAQYLFSGATKEVMFNEQGNRWLHYIRCPLFITAADGVTLNSFLFLCTFNTKPSHVRTYTLVQRGSFYSHLIGEKLQKCFQVKLDRLVQ